jgi:hypothetical protein
MWNLFSSGICVYDWSLWKPMLITNVCADARRIGAKFDERPERLLRRLPRRADRVLVHLDISDDSPFIASAAGFSSALVAHGIEVLNCNVRDIRKRTVQSACMAYGLPSLIPTPTGPADELLIVKTDLNSGGVREQMLPGRVKKRFNLPPQAGVIKSPKGYFVSRRSQIAPELWKDQELVIEKYLTNPDGRFFRIYVMKSAIVISAGYSQDRLKRMGGDVRRQNHWFWRDRDSIAPFDADPKLPSALLRTLGVFIDRFDVDYAAIDVIESESGEFYIVDVNKTPYWGSEFQAGLLEHLRRGLQSEVVGIAATFRSGAQPG